MRQPSLPNPQGHCGEDVHPHRDKQWRWFHALGTIAATPLQSIYDCYDEDSWGEGACLLVSWCDMETSYTYAWSLFSAMVLKIRPLMSSVLAPCSSRSLAILTLYGGAISTTHLDHVLVVLNDFTEQHDVFFYLMVMHVSSTRPKPSHLPSRQAQTPLLRRHSVSHDNGKGQSRCFTWFWW